MKLNRAYAHCTPVSWTDSLGPDPYEVIQGFRQVAPAYLCVSCWERKPDVDSRYIFDRDCGFHEEKMLCDECWEKARNT